MKLTPLDVKKQEFRKTLRGFDPIEVQTFLEMVAEEYENVLEDNKQIERKLVELETRLSDYQETEKNLRETLLNVQEVKKQSEESSRRQAGLVVKEAELKAMEIIENARKQARKMRDEVNILQTQKESFINRLRQILISQIELLSVLEIDDAIPEEAQEYLENVKRKKRKNIRKDAASLAEIQETEETEETEDLEKSVISIPTQTEEIVEDVSVAAENNEASDFSISADFIQTESDEVSELENAEKAVSDELKETESDDINEFFKKGIQIDELIRNLDKKQQK